MNDCCPICGRFLAISPQDMGEDNRKTLFLVAGTLSGNDEFTALARELWDVHSLTGAGPTLSPRLPVLAVSDGERLR